MQELITITELKRRVADGRAEARVHGQLGLQQKSTKEGKPYFDVGLTDGGGNFSIKAWSNSPQMARCTQLNGNEFVEINGEFFNSNFGMDSKNWSLRVLTDEERDELLIGSPDVRQKLDRDFQDVSDLLDSVRDPRLRAVNEAFMKQHGAAFLRAAAARKNHHARRGGLLEHVAQMMRCSAAICEVYPLLNRDLLLTAVLFHDCGKLWENGLPADGFASPFDETGELLGHISIGARVLDELWLTLSLDQWNDLRPASEDVRLHLLHLVLSHHGSHEWGSPVVPKTPEAYVLHHVDNIDAKLEMMAGGYAGSTFIAPRIQQRANPLPGNLVRPLEKFEGEL